MPETYKSQDLVFDNKQAKQNRIIFTGPQYIVFRSRCFTYQYAVSLCFAYPGYRSCAGLFAFFPVLVPLSLQQAYSKFADHTFTGNKKSFR